MGECQYCETVEQKKNLLYEGVGISAVVPERPITKGQVRVIPKKHYKSMQDIDDKELERLFYASSYAAVSMFETLRVQGTNIIANTGGALKKDGHFHIDVVARTTDDGLNLMWRPRRISESEMESVRERIKDKCDLIGVEKKEKKVVDLDRKPEKLKISKEKPSETEKEKQKKAKKEEKKKEKESDTDSTDKESYLVKQLRRLP